MYRVRAGVRPTSAVSYAGGREHPNKRDEGTVSLHISTPHVAEVSVTFTDTAGDAKCESTFYVEDNTDAIFSSVPAFTTQVWNAWVTNVVPQLASEVISNGVIFEDQRTLPYVGAFFPQAATAGGQTTGTDSKPNQTSFAVKRLTSGLGRSNRGRLYWPIWSNTNFVGQNAIDSTYANAIVAALTAFQAAVEGGALPCLMGVVSKQTAGAPRLFGQFTQISSWAYSDLTLDSQRRRLPGRGR